MSPVPIASCIAGFAASPLGPWRDATPWSLTSRAVDVVAALLTALPADEFEVSGDIAVHKTAKVEAGAVLKGPLVVGAGSLVATGACLRGGCWIADDCVVGHGVEVKSSFVFAGTSFAHFNFVGDSIVGFGVNLEAGSIVCNCRNERPGEDVLVRVGGELLRTGIRKFGALIGDGCRIGANAVIAPGALLLPGTVVDRAALLDQERG